MEKHQEKLRNKPDSPSAGADERYCPVCGKDVSDHSLKRFGEYFCSEAHVTEYAREVRARAGKEQAAVAEGRAVQPDGTEPTAGEKGGLSRRLKLGACCAAPILALAILVPLLGSGTTGLAAIAGNLLTFALFLACPLGMYFMMRGMQRTQQGEKGEGHEEPKDRKVLPPGRGKPRGSGVAGASSWGFWSAARGGIRDS